MTAVAPGAVVTVHAVEMQIKLDTSFQVVANNIQGFREDFRIGVADAIDIAPNRVEILKVAPGSILVDFRILDLPAGSTAAASVRSSAASADLLEALLLPSSGGGSPSFLALRRFPSNLRPFMEKASVNQKVFAEVSTQSLGNPGVATLAPLEEGFAPPEGCTCSGAFQSQGVALGCARHLGLDRPWCPVVEDCPGASVGSGCQRLWVYCSSGSAEFMSEVASTPRTSASSWSQTSVRLAPTGALLVWAALFLQNLGDLILL
jgi:hypothetical protein